MGVTDGGQFLETRLHQINEVARLLNLPPTLIGGSLEAGLTYANQTAKAQRLIDQLPAPGGQPLGPELDRKLLTKAGRATHYFQYAFHTQHPDRASVDEPGRPGAVRSSFAGERADSGANASTGITITINVTWTSP